MTSQALSKEERETGSRFAPKFDDKGLVTAVVQHFATREILMVAFMNQEAIDQTLQSGFAHFYSRSRGKQWMKGESSGNKLTVHEVLTDCDQDAVILMAEPAGPTCHTGARSCFYRMVEGGGLAPVSD